MIVLVYTLSVLLMILLPIMLAAWLRKKAPVPWLLFSVGCLTFIVSQVVHLPLNEWLADLGLMGESAASEIPLWQTALVAGLTAGLCEELARAAGYALIQRFKPAWMKVQHAVMLGIGHGGFESMVFGGVLTAATVSSWLAMQGMDLSQLGLTPEQLEFLTTQLDRLANDPGYAFIPLFERLVAIGLHVTCSLLVWRAFARGRFVRDWVFLAAAILYHAAVDFLAVYFVQTGMENPILFEAFFALITLPGLAFAYWMYRKNSPAPAAAASAATGRSAAPGRPGLPEGGLRGELSVLWISTVKELVQLWRTKRLLVMGAVFLLFGMGSPLLAKLTPEIIGSFAEAEMFADLIPEPTGADAMLQYVENISQFGFILAILLGMGVVAGEKERGTAQMILSKPMSRWGFITSKFLAQAIMYLGGFVLAGLGAYYYTLILFGSLDFGGFALLNGLLLLWLLTFVALSLLASTLASSTAAAGGIGLGLSVALMLAGNLPTYGALMPSGLIGWATQAGVKASGSAASAMFGGGGGDAAAVANGGAAAVAVVVIVLSLVLALGVFEQQEL